MQTMPDCVDCIKSHDGDPSVVADNFGRFIEFGGPMWTEDQSKDALSLAVEFGYSVVFAGPTGPVDNDDSPEVTGWPSAEVSVVTFFPSTTDSGSASPSASAMPSPTATFAPTEPTSTSRSWIAGAVLGPVVFIALVIGLGWFLPRRRRKLKQGHDNDETDNGHGALYGKPELQGDGVKQTAPAEMEVKKQESVELAGHDAANELPGNEDETRYGSAEGNTGKIPRETESSTTEAATAAEADRSVEVVPDNVEPNR